MTVLKAIYEGLMGRVKDFIDCRTPYVEALVAVVGHPGDIPPELEALRNGYFCFFCYGVC